MLIDSNITIYSCKPGGEFLHAWTRHPQAASSLISRVETFGLPGIEADERAAVEGALNGLVEYEVDAEVAARAVALRQQRKMSLGDAIIAATALEHGLPLVTRNTADFQHIEGLKLINPFDPA